MNKTKQLNKLNNLLDKQIQDENQEIFTNMICYLRGANISEYDIEVVRQDLTEMVLSAQKRGDNIASVVGDDYKQFCDDVIANLPPKTWKQKTIDIADIICSGISILLLINILISEEFRTMIKNLSNGEPNNFNISFSVGTIATMLFIIIMATFITKLILKNVFREEIKKKRIIVFILYFAFMCFLVGVMLIGKSTMITMNIFIALICVIVFFILHKILASIN